MTLRSALFVTWDGPGQTYLESLYFPVFGEMSRFGWKIDTLQMVYGPPVDVTRTAEAAARHGLAYQPVHGRGGWGRSLNLAAGALVLGARAFKYDLVIARSLVPASVVLAVPSARRRFVFDADGLVADERIEFAGWKPAAAPYEAFRFVERAAVLRARATLVRTEKAKAVIVARAGAGQTATRVHVVANGKDAAAFHVPSEADRRATRRDAGIGDDALWLVYCGSIGPQYRIPETIRLFESVRRRRPDARLSILTGSPDRAAAIVGARADVDIRRLTPTEVGRALGAADIGIGLRTPSFSQQAVSPIKIAEYLLSGLPTVTTRVGDLGEELGANPGVLLLDVLDDASLDRAAAWIVDDVAQHRKSRGESARAAGVALYSHTTCARKYANVLDQAMEPSSPPE